MSNQCWDCRELSGKARPVLALLLVVGSASLLAAPPGSGLDRWGDPLPDGAVARMGTVRLRSTGRLSGLALSPDGKTLLSCDFDAGLRTWDVATGHLVRTWKVHSFRVSYLTYSQDGTLLVAACTDGVVRLLDAKTGTVKHQLRDPTQQRRGTTIAALSPDGRTLVSTQRTDRQLTIWDVERGKVRHRVTGFPAGPGNPPTVHFTPDSRQFVTQWSDGRIHLVDVASGKSVRCLDQAAKAVPTGKGRFKGPTRRLALTLTPDGKTLIYCVSNDPAFHVIDVSTGKEVKRIERVARALPRDGVAISPNGRFLYEPSTDGTIRVWGLASGQLVRELAPSAGGIQNLCLSRDGNLVAAASGHVLHVWDVATGVERHATGGHASQVSRLAFTPDARRLVSLDLGSVAVWETATGRILHHHPAAGVQGNSPLTVTADGMTANWVGYDFVRYSLAISVDREPARFVSTRLSDNFHTRVLSPDGKIVACIHDEDRKLRLRHLGEDKPDRDLATLPSDNAYELVFSPDGRLLAVSSTDRTLTLYEVATGLEVRKVMPEPADEERPTNVVFSRDGRSLLYHDGDLRLIEVLTGSERLRFPREPKVPYAMQLSDDGRLVARGQYEGEAIVYDTWTGRELFRRNGEQGDLHAVAISRDNRLLATGGANTTALVWRLPALPAPERLKLTGAAAWEDLGSLDAATAYRAMMHLSARPEAAVRLLVERLKPKPAGDQKRAAKLVEELGHDRFAVRERATAELEEMGQAAEEALKKAARSTSLETKQRAEDLLHKLDGGGPLSPLRLRRERAVELLERIGNAKAREALKQLLEAKPDAAFADTIQRALSRLGEAG